jgi:DNA-binding IclR family transcriptional regulator
MGKATLAYGESIAAELDALDKPLRPLTGHTIVSVEKLRKELVAIRRQGFSVDNEEALPGVRCVAAPILSPVGLPMAAVALQGPSVRMSRDRIKRLAPLVRAAAEELARVMPPSHRL